MEKIPAEAVRRALGGAFSHVPVRSLDTVDSTNLRVKEEARAGLIRAPYLLIADCQTAGRGRLGRSFVSPPGTGLYMSLLADVPPDTESGKITILAAVAVCGAIEEMTPLSPRIKWVNDVFAGGKKVSGILAERIGAGVIIGIGVNVLPPPGGFPEEAGAAGALGLPLDRTLLAGRIAGRMLEMLKNPSDPAILEAYRARMFLTGRIVRYTRGNEEKSARVTGVAEDGGLLIETGRGPEVLRSGEVSLGSQSLSDLEYRQPQ